MAGWATLCILMPGKLLAQGTSPWEEAVGVLLELFTGVIGRCLWLAAFVVGGLILAFGGGRTRALGWRVVFLGLVIGGVNILALLW